MTGSSGPLAGLRVIELGTLLAGPFCGQLLGDFGAEVIKVEPPGQGDPMRVWGREKAHGKSLWWPVVARNKKAITLDLRQPEGQEILKSLVAESDFLLENFRPGTLEKWGLGWAELSAINPTTDHDPRLRLRPDGPVFAPGGLWRHRRGDGRPAVRGGRPHHSAFAHGDLDRRLAGGDVRLHRRAVGTAPPAQDRSRPGRRFGDLRSRAQHDGVARHRVRQDRLHPRAHRRHPAERRPVQCLQDPGWPGADRRQPGHGVCTPRRGHGSAGPCQRPAVCHAQCPGREPERTRRAGRALDQDARRRAASST